MHCQNDLCVDVALITREINDMEKTLLSVLKIGIACSRESAKERMNIEDVTKELHSIRSSFLGDRANATSQNHERNS